MKENELAVSSRINGNKQDEKDSSLLILPDNEESLWTSNPAYNDEIKIKKISTHFREIMLTLGLNLNDDSLKGTPDRIARMYVSEMFSGLDPKKEPKITLFENKFHYNEMLVEKNITLHSCCEHHFVPIVGKVHVGYFSSGKLIGLSKINRIVNYYSKRPQLQERLTEQSAEALKNSLETNDVAIVINAAPMCLTTRGITDTDCKTLTNHYSGKFKNEEVKKEFLTYLERG